MSHREVFWGQSSFSFTSTTYIDDAIDIVTTFMKKFADDTKVGAVTYSLLQCRKLQEQINSLKRWADIMQMSFNADNCVVMHLCSKNLQHSYLIDGRPMKSTDCEKDIEATSSHL